MNRTLPFRTSSSQASLWLHAVVAATAAPLLFAGCSSLSLLEEKLKTSEDELGIVTRPYPGWETKAKATLDAIPTAEEKKAAASGKNQPHGAQAQAAQAQEATVKSAPPPIPAQPPVSTNVAPAAAADTGMTITPEQPTAVNPAGPAATVAPQVPVPSPSAPLPLPAESPAAPLNNPSVLAHPTPERPLAVTSAELAAPVPTPALHASADNSSGIPSAPKPQGQSSEQKKEPTPAERLAALMKQRGELLTAFKAEVERRRMSTENEQELRRLEQELRLLYLTAEQPDEAVRQIEALDVPEREAFTHLLMGLTTWMNADEAHRPTMRNAKVLREIRDAAGELAAASKLDVRNLAFCEKVESYGWYTEFSRNQFKPKQQVILYAEVENFTAEKTGDEAYETELQGSYQIFDSRGNLVDERELPRDKEVCRNYRRDYFLAYLIYLPDGLSPGNYRLELTVEDIKGSASRQKDPARSSRRSSPAEQAEKGSSSAYKGRKLGEGTIEFSVK